MADSTSGARQVAQDTDMETIIQKTAAPPAAPEAAQEAPVEAPEAAPAPPVQAPAPEAAQEAPVASEGRSADDRIAALEQALQEMRAEREEAAKQALEDKRSRILSDAGLTQEYAVLLDGDPGSWQQKAALLSSLRGGNGDKKPVSVPRDPIMNSDTMGATNIEEQAAGFFGLS
jgi:hypothetical protein